MQLRTLAEVQQCFAAMEAGLSPTPHHGRAAARAGTFQLR